jgi:hypothetical protein
MTVLIKDLGDDVSCNSKEELEKVLLQKYLGKSISLVSKLPSGIGHITFVDVQADGTAIDSYTSDEICLNDLFD